MSRLVNKFWQRISAWLSLDFSLDGLEITQAEIEEQLAFGRGNQ